MSVTSLEMADLRKYGTRNVEFAIDLLIFYLVFYVTLSSLICMCYMVTESWKGGGKQKKKSWLRFCTVNGQPMASKYQLSHISSSWDLNSHLSCRMQVCYQPVNELI